MVLATSTASVSEKVEENGPPHDGSKEQGHSAQSEPPDVLFHAIILLDACPLQQALAVALGQLGKNRDLTHRW